MASNGPYNPLDHSGAQIVLYGASPYPYDPPPRVEPWWPQTVPYYWPQMTPEQFAEAMKKYMEANPPKVEPPPVSAADSEVNAVNVLAKLTPEERARVLRFAVAKWGPVTV